MNRPLPPSRLLLTTLVAVAATLGRPATADDAPPAPTYTLPRATPESQGVSSAAVLEFIDALDQIDAVNSVMLLRNGRVITEGWWTPYDAASNHELYSLSKSFTSTAVGFAVTEGRLSLDDEVLKFFPEDAPAEPSANLKAMRVRDLLTMSTGNQDETSSAPDQVSARTFLAHPVPHKPGSHFRYNTPATFMLSAIVQKQTGQTVLDYLQPRLFEPLGIRNPVWNTNHQGISLGGYGLRVTTEDIARFGQFYLQKGEWRGRQRLPAAWVDLATSRQMSNGSNPRSDWDQGYGFQFWRCRHGAYRGDGAFGQYCIVFPEQHAVLAITSGLRDMQAVLDLVWDKLLPGFKGRRLAGDRAVQARLSDRLAHLTVRTPEGKETSPNAAGVYGRKFAFPANDQQAESVSLQPGPDGRGWVLVSRAGGADQRIPCGYREWRYSRGPFGQYRDEPLAASGAWVADDTFVAKVCARETPFYATLRFRFDGAQVQRELEVNIGFSATKTPPLTGRAEP